MSDCENCIHGDVCDKWANTSKVRDNELVRYYVDDGKGCMYFIEKSELDITERFNY